MTPRRVLITRATHQASALAESLRALGIEPVLIPTIEIAEPTTFAPLDAALASLDTFHWLLFTSANAVEAFHRRRLSTHPSLVILSAASERSDRAQSKDLQPTSCPAIPLEPSGHEFPLLIAAIGAGTARKLEAIGLTPALVPVKAVAESLAEALTAYARQPDGSSTRLLLVRAEQARDILPDTLRAAGAEVLIAPAYRTLIPAESIPAIRDLFKFPATCPDAIIFTSSSTATNLLALLEAAGLKLPMDIQRISIGPITSQTLRDMHLPPHAEAAEPTLPALVEILRKSLNL